MAGDRWRDSRLSGFQKARGPAKVAGPLVFWGARNENAAETFKAVLVAGCIANALDCLILLHATATGLLNGLGWLQVLINGGLAVGFWYFTYGKGKST